MKVTVTKFLNVRVGSASVNAPNYQYLAPGTELEVLDQIILGDAYENDQRWLKDEAGNYYWVGGTNYDILQKDKNEGSPSSENQFLEALKKYPGTGEGIGVAILDSGVFLNNPFLQNRIQLYKDFIASGDDENISAHGSKVAGIITSDLQEFGRNTSNIYCFRVANRSNNVNNDAVLKALKFILENETVYKNISLINLSLDVIQDYLGLIQPFVDQLLAKNILCTVAAGEGTKTNTIHQLNKVIKVGVFNQGESVSSSFDLAYLNKPIPTCGKKSNSTNAKIGRDSAYCAYTTALLARHFSTSREQVTHQNALQNLSSIALDYSTALNYKPYQAYSV